MKIKPYVVSLHRCGFLVFLCTLALRFEGAGFFLFVCLCSQVHIPAVLKGAAPALGEVFVFVCSLGK